MAVDATKVLLIGGAGVAVWYFYFRTPATAAATSTATPVTTGITPAPPASSGPSLDTLYAQMVAAGANDPGVKAGTAGPDTWDYFLMQVYPGFSAPDPLVVFPGVDRTQPMSSATYWASMSQWLRANKGLSGFGCRGLGMFAGLGMLQRMGPEFKGTWTWAGIGGR